MGNDCCTARRDPQPPAGAGARADEVPSTMSRQQRLGSQDSTGDRQAGVGLQLTMRGEEPEGREWVVQRVIDGSPAWLGEVKEGDVLVSIDGTQLGGMSTMGEVSKHLLGPTGSCVECTFMRGGSKRWVELFRAGTDSFVATRTSSGTEGAGKRKGSYVPVRDSVGGVCV